MSNVSDIFQPFDVSVTETMTETVLLSIKMKRSVGLCHKKHILCKNLMMTFMRNQTNFLSSNTKVLSRDND